MKAFYFYKRNQMFGLLHYTTDILRIQESKAGDIGFFFEKLLKMCYNVTKYKE